MSVTMSMSVWIPETREPHDRFHSNVTHTLYTVHCVLWAKKSFQIPV